MFQSDNVGLVAQEPFVTKKRTVFIALKNTRI